MKRFVYDNRQSYINRLLRGGRPMLTHDEMNQCIDDYSQYLTQISYMYVKNWATAEEIVQDTFIAYFKKPEKYKQTANLKTYLTRICMNKSIDQTRSLKARTNAFLKYFQQSEETFVTSADALLMERLKQSEVIQNVLSLPIKYREVIVYYYFEEMTSRAIADLLKIPEGTVKVRLNRARQLLKKTIQGENLEVKPFE